MIMSGDKKKIAQIIVGKFGKDAAERNAEAFEERAGEPEKPEIDEGLLAVAEEAQAALNRKDAAAFAKAMKDFVYMCDSMPHEEGPHEEEEKPNPILG